MIAKAFLTGAELHEVSEVHVALISVISLKLQAVLSPCDEDIVIVFCRRPPRVKTAFNLR